MIEGVSKGWTKDLELVGVGYRASNQGQKLDLALGFSHNIVLELAPEVKVETISEKGKNPIIKLSSFDKQLVGQIAAKIRSFRAPEPYKGKGVKFVGEILRRKAVDDVNGVTLASVSSKNKEIKANTKAEAASAVGKSIAEKASKVGVETVAFDRNGYLYHGRVKLLADAAREAGLKF
ncbi:UNVERIFIED_CONTAM: hypothetical protein GTU68_029268 [Idotea baltica]|nr:hypothetical protein [Idotea baltica]